MTKSKYHVRWMIRRDMPRVIEIETASFEFPWNEADFIRMMRQRNTIGMVAEDRGTDEVVGHMVYTLSKDSVYLDNFAVDPNFRRMGVGTDLANKIKSKVGIEMRRKRLTLNIRESNLPGLQFFKAMGFTATGIERDFYDDTVEDAYVMRYPSLVTIVPKNRISRAVK